MARDFPEHARSINDLISCVVDLKEVIMDKPSINSPIFTALLLSLRGNVMFHNMKLHKIVTCVIIKKNRGLLWKLL